MKTPTRLALVAFASALLIPTAVKAVPSYARQTGMACIVCHSEFPILTDFGRQFKLGGFDLSTNQTDLPPLAVMLQPSFTHTNKAQDGGAAPGFKPNNNFAVDQTSLFYAGRLFGPYADSLFGSSAGAFLNKFGTFFQGTYDGVAKQLHWDNAELRFADNTTVAGQTVAYGIYANNNPTMQDPWNTTPAWGFPFAQSALAQTPGAGTLIDGGLAQQVLGLGAYAMIGSHVYVDVGGYRNLSGGFQRAMGIDPTGETQVAGIAPYWRAAYTNTFGNKSFEAGFFGMAASAYPGRDTSAGKDHYTDWGADSQFQVASGKSDITTLLTWIHETETLGASQKLGGASNLSDNVWTLRGAVDYLYDKTYGGAVGYFVTDGSHDAAFHSESATGSPLSDGVVFQLNWIPFNKGGGPSFWPKSNVKISLQYVMYNRFDGARHNYDGHGANASDNNTLYLQTWFVF